MAGRRAIQPVLSTAGLQAVAPRFGDDHKRFIIGRQGSAQPRVRILASRPASVRCSKN